MHCFDNRCELQAGIFVPKLLKIDYAARNC
jgi:hypothetical protein